MSTCRAATVAATAFASLLLIGCATVPEKPAGGPEAAPMQTKKEDPFKDCQAQPREGVSVLQCGDVVSVLATESGDLTGKALEQNLEQFQAQFPPDAKRERFTLKLGDRSATGIRVIQPMGGSPFRAELLIVPVDKSKTQIVSCAVRGTTEFERCSRMLEVLSTSGIPDNLVPGD